MGEIRMIQGFWRDLWEMSEPGCACQHLARVWPALQPKGAGRSRRFCRDVGIWRVFLCLNEDVPPPSALRAHRSEAEGIDASQKPISELMINYLYYL